MPLQGRGLQWHQEKPLSPPMTFKQQWDALPPLPEFHSGGRARSLQASIVAQGTAASFAADLVCNWRPLLPIQILHLAFINLTPVAQEECPAIGGSRSPELEESPDSVPLSDFRCAGFTCQVFVQCVGNTDTQSAQHKHCCLLQHQSRG